jgi:hypothetical protein
MGTGVRAVQRSLHRLEDCGLMNRLPVRQTEAQKRVEFDLSGLVRELQDLAKLDLSYRERLSISDVVQLRDFD